MRSSGSRPKELAEDYEDRRPLYEELSANLEEQVRRALESLDHIDRIEFRVKGTGSFVEKCFDDDGLCYDEPFVDVEDQIAGRVIVFFLEDIETVSNRITDRLNTVEVERHRPDRDKAFGYESEHRICTIPPLCEPEGWEELELHPGTFELQIRTIFMHAYAEPQHDLEYKAPEELPPDTRRELAWIAASAWGADQAFQRIHDRHAEGGHEPDADVAEATA